jgi:hypothetical protein
VATEALTGTEAEIARWWTEILGVPVERGDDDFFELGGDSLGLVRFLRTLWDTRQVDLDLTELFATDVTVTETARAVERALAELAALP